MADERGRFLTFEGGEGAGKSTQVLLLADALRARGIEVITTREPGGTPGAEALRTLLLDPAFDWTPRAEALLFAAARSDHVDHLIEPALASGAWVLCDRFIDSSRAYQGGRAGISDSVLLDLHKIATAGLFPDLTLLLEVDPLEANERTARRDEGASDRIGGKSAAYHAEVRASFSAMACNERERFAVIEGSGTPMDVHKRIMAVVAPLVERG